MTTLGPLVPADETFHHQITDTVATVAPSDRSWTEKVCGMAAPLDGPVQVGFGMGKHTNRGVLDACMPRTVPDPAVRRRRPVRAPGR